MDLSIVIVSFNTKDLLLDCLTALANSTDKLKKEIIVIDNHSTDGSVAAINKQFPHVKCLRNHENPGFGIANNQAAAQATGEYILYLNSDTRVSPDSLQTLIEKARQNHAKLATGTLHNKDGSLQPQGGALPTLSNIAAWMLFLDDMPFLQSLFTSYQQRRPQFFAKDQIMGWVGGTALLISRELNSELGGFNPQIFMYAEDVDLCLRASKEQGVKPYYFVIPPIIHIGQGSGSQKNSLVGEYSGLMYVLKTYYPAWQIPIFTLLLKIGALARLIIFGMILGSEDKKRAYQQALTVV